MSSLDLEMTQIVIPMSHIISDSVGKFTYRQNLLLEQSQIILDDRHASPLMREVGEEVVIIFFVDKDQGFFIGSFFRMGNGDADYDMAMQCSINFLKALALF